MTRSASSRWRMAITVDGHPDHLVVASQFYFDGQGELDSWTVTVYLERLSGPPYEADDLPPRAPIAFDHEFRNLYYVRGQLSPIHANDEFVLWAELAFGIDEDVPQYFEGAIIRVTGTTLTGNGLTFDSIEAVVPEPAEPVAQPHKPVDQPAETAVIGGEPELESMTDDGELFPYVYMRTWLAPDPELLALEFTGYPYPLDAAPSGSYLQGLHATRRADPATARIQMAMSSVAYVEGRAGQDAPFVTDIQTLGAPINQYPRIYRLLASGGGRSSASVMAELWRALGITPDYIAEYLRSEDHISAMVQVWQSYFALVILLNQAPGDRDQLTQLLIVDHALTQLSEPSGQAPGSERLDALSKTVVRLPAGLFPLPPLGGSFPVESPVESSIVSERPVIAVCAIGDLQMVKQRLRGYELGELAYVDCVQVGERRESVRRNKQSTQTTTTRSQIESDVQDTGSHTTSASLSGAVLSALADAVLATNYQDFSTSYGPPTIATLNGGWTVEQKPGTAPARHDVTRFARDVLSRTVHRMTRQVTELRSVSALHESEQSVTSTVDNSVGGDNRRAAYYWLNKVYDAYVVNYGNRMMIEMIVAGPADRLLRSARDPAEARRQPLPPAALGIESFEDITVENFPLLVARYPGSDLTMPPAPRQVVSLTLRSGDQRVVSLPDGYEAIEAFLGYAVPSGPTPVTVQGLVGQTSFEISDASTGTRTLAMSREVDSVVVAIDSTPPVVWASLSPPEPVQGDRLFTLEIVTQPTAYALDAWRLSVFQAINRAYASALRTWGDGDATVMGAQVQSPARLRDIERRELRHAAIELLFEHTAHRLGVGATPSGVRVSEFALAQPRYLYFFETAYEWSDMSYSFMGYRAHPDLPAGSMIARSAGEDRRFERFVHAAYARILVPVKLDHAPAVLYQLATGEVWDGPAEFVATTEADVPVRADLVKLAPDRAQVEALGAAWPVIVPTDIAVLGDGDLPVLPRPSNDRGSGRRAKER